MYIICHLIPLSLFLLMDTLQIPQVCWLLRVEGIYRKKRSGAVGLSLKCQAVTQALLMYNKRQQIYHIFLCCRSSVHACSHAISLYVGDYWVSLACVCLLGPLCCDVGVMSDRLFLSPSSILDNKARCKEKSHIKKIYFIFITQPRWGTWFYTHTDFKSLLISKRCVLGKCWNDVERQQVHLCRVAFGW